MKYPIRIYWSERDRVYVADAITLKGCCATGETPEEAAREIEIAMELWLESADLMGKTVPKSNMDLEDLAAATPIINLSGLAQEAGIPRQTLMTKIRRGTALSEKEKKKINAVLDTRGIKIAN